MRVIEFVKGGLNGSINVHDKNRFTAVGGSFSKDFKTLKGAEKFLNNKGYERA